MYVTTTNTYIARAMHDNKKTKKHHTAPKEANTTSTCNQDNKFNTRPKRGTDNTPSHYVSTVELCGVCWNHLAVGGADSSLHCWPVRLGLTPLARYVFCVACPPFFDEHKSHKLRCTHTNLHAGTLQLACLYYCCVVWKPPST